MAQAGDEWSSYNIQMHITLTTVSSRGDVQPFIAQGVAPDPLPRRQLDQQKLAASDLVTVSNGQMRKRAAALVEVIRQEDGMEKAVAIVEQHLD